MLLDNGMNICLKNCTEMESNALSLIRKRRKQQREWVVLTVVLVNIATVMYAALQSLRATVNQINHMQYERKDKKRHRVENLAMLIRESDVMCKKELRMDRRTFSVLCEMVRDIGGLRGTRNMPLEEIVAMFLYTLAHNKNNRSVASYFSRSGESVSRHFNRCLLAVLKLHRDLMVKRPTPITEDCEDDTWRCFKNCLGALDGTYIKVHVGNEDRPRYRTKNGYLAMNVLGVCTPNMEFVFVSSGWEGSADDARVLQDAISRPNGLKVPRGCYYLVDAEYTNCEGFLAPYRGHRYHLKEWSDRPPMSAEECFNMKHAKARNVIRRCFGLLKGRMEASSHQSGRGKNKRYWKKDEEEILLDTLEEISKDPTWKGEGGFKNGFMVHLANVLNEKFPGAGLKAMPHIDSKLKWFKDKHNVIHEMLKLPGFKWCDKTKTVKSDKQVYDDFVKKHPKAAGLWNTPFPFLDKLDSIYNIERANGQTCEMVEDSVENCEQDVGELNLDLEGEDNAFDYDSTNHVPSHISPPTKKARKESAPKSKEDKGILEGLSDADLTVLNNITSEFGGFLKDVNAHLASIATSMTACQRHEQEIMLREKELVEQKRNLLSEIATLPEITDIQAIRAAKLLAANPSDMEIYYSSPSIEWKKKFIVDLLGLGTSSSL